MDDVPTILTPEGRKAYLKALDETYGKPLYYCPQCGHYIDEEECPWPHLSIEELVEHKVWMEGQIRLARIYMENVLWLVDEDSALAHDLRDFIKEHQEL